MIMPFHRSINCAGAVPFAYLESFVHSHKTKKKRSWEPVHLQKIWYEGSCSLHPVLTISVDPVYPLRCAHITMSTRELWTSCWMTMLFMCNRKVLRALGSSQLRNAVLKYDQDRVSIPKHLLDRLKERQIKNLRKKFKDEIMKYRYALASPMTATTTHTLQWIADAWWKPCSDSLTSGASIWTPRPDAAILSEVGRASMG